MFRARVSVRKGEFLLNEVSFDEEPDILNTHDMS